ncbi:MAG: prolipoprotein diacylglyceryl transferase [Candidatus Gracilibacteria bacterium]|nr:prolipoprotein diacylglyceryl transferase [Candidatus Gracilibacteria bacterium]
MQYQLDSAYFQVKIVADMLGYISGFLSGYLFYKYFFKNNQVTIPFRDKEEKLFYYLGLFGFAMGFGILVSTFDYYIVHGAKNGLVLSKTVAGAIAGGVIASEIFKKVYKIKFNRGVLFVPSLTIGILVGRIGAFMIGLRDNTHGLATNLPWGYDYGDGILRHPTQIYEIIVLLLIFIIFVIGINTKKEWWINNGFFIFTLIYFTYRFLVGFVMPYSHFWFGLNSIQVVSIGMIVYSVYKLKKYAYGK